MSLDNTNGREDEPLRQPCSGVVNLNENLAHKAGGTAEACGVQSAYDIVCSVVSALSKHDGVAAARGAL